MRNFLKDVLCVDLDRVKSDGCEEEDRYQWEPPIWFECVYSVHGRTLFPNGGPVYQKVVATRLKGVLYNALKSGPV